MKLTRRRLAGVMLGSAAALGQPPQTSTRTPGEELAAAKDRIRRNSGTLAKFKIPMDTEPAFQFRA